MLKSSSPLDEFHWILKMKRRVAGGGGGVVGAEGKRRKWQNKKRENHSNISSAPQRHCNALMDLQFIPWEKKSGREVVWGGREEEKEGGEGGRRRWRVPLIGMWGALTWGSPASQNRQKPPISRRLRAVRRGRRRGRFCELKLLSTNILNNFKMSLHEL